VSPGSALVIGGGLAGITAALRLADAGAEVVLVEARPRLGGAAFSFRRGELTVDNGQHVFLRCCDAYRGLLHRLDVEDQVHLQPRLDIPVLRPDGRRARLSRLPKVPAPLHLGAALAGYGLLSPADRLRAVRGALALRRLDPEDPALDLRSLGSYLRAHGQNDAVIDALWGVVATATLNLEPDAASLALAAKVFRTGLLDRADAADVGYAVAPLGALHSDAAAVALERAGVEVLRSTRVENLDSASDTSSKDTASEPVTARVRGRSGERTLCAASAVVALGHRDAYAISPALAEQGARRGPELGSSPILNVHLVYDRRVTDLAFAAVVGSPAQWVFDRTESSGLRRTQPRGQYLAITVSAADALINEPSRTLCERFDHELRALLPSAGDAVLTDAFVTRERRATFRQAPGSAALRPGARTDQPFLALAGAWTATGWPDTMESAVRSGVAAADVLLRGTGRTGDTRGVATPVGAQPSGRIS